MKKCSIKHAASVKYCYVNSFTKMKLNTQAEVIHLTVNFIFSTESP